MYSVCESTINEHGTIAETRHRSTHEKPTRITMCPPEVTHDLTWDRNHAAAAGSRLLTPALLYATCVCIMSIGTSS
jgi:hypothetical protein